MKIAIWGYGDEGQALEELYLESHFGQPLIKDDKRNDYKRYKKLHVLNICIPYSDDFLEIVLSEISRYDPELTIIHSIVPPYTTKTIVAKTHKSIVHSPMRYTRLKLTKSLTTFVKYIGFENKKDARMAREHFIELGMVKNKMFNPSFVTELNSLLSIVYYAHNIVFADYIADLFENFKGLGEAKYESFIHFNNSYNRGYRRLRMKHLNRPTLVPPENKKIEGNIINYTKMIHEIVPHEITKRILKYE